MQIPAVTLQKLLFEPTLVRSPLRVVQWWESRRLTYNAIVGGAGLFTLTYATAWMQVLEPHPIEWRALLIGSAAYGISANVCYTMGWVAENLVERWMQRPVYGLGPALFRYGLVFSIGLSLLPSVLITVAGIAGLLFGGR